jgi:hypothetical protein
MSVVFSRLMNVSELVLQILILKLTLRRTRRFGYLLALNALKIARVRT